MSLFNSKSHFPCTLCSSSQSRQKCGIRWVETGTRTLTVDKLQRRGWQLPNRCFLCGHAEETVHHILLHCSEVSSLWEIIFSLVGVGWTFPKIVLSWRGFFVGKKRKKVWNLVPLCIFWIVWKEKNCIAFKDGPLVVQKLKYSFVYNLWS